VGLETLTGFGAGSKRQQGNTKNTSLKKATLYNLPINNTARYFNYDFFCWFYSRQVKKKVGMNKEICQNNIAQHPCV
jgi:hypothetical protein